MMAIAGAGTQREEDRTTITADALRAYREDITAAERRRAHAACLALQEYRGKLAQINADYDAGRLAASNRYQDRLRRHIRGGLPRRGSRA